MKTSRNSMLDRCLKALFTAVVMTVAVVSVAHRAEAAVVLKLNGFAPPGAPRNFVPVEWSSTPVSFTFTVTPTPGSGGPLTGYVCADDKAAETCTAVNLPSGSGSIHGFVPWVAPSATAKTSVNLKFCLSSQANVPVNGADCMALVTDSMATPVSALFTISIEKYTIHHTRAIHDDTVAITLLGGTFNLAPECFQTPNPICVQNSLQGNHNNGTYVGKGATIGPFPVIPGQPTGLRFGFAIYNFRAGYSMAKYNELAANVSSILGNAMTEQIVSGDSVAIAVPTYTDVINHLGWRGCDGPLAVDLVGLYNVSKLFAETGNNLLEVPMGSYRFKSQIGCGESPDYTLVYSVSQTSWRPGYAASPLRIIPG